LGSQSSIFAPHAEPFSRRKLIPRLQKSYFQISQEFALMSAKLASRKNVMLKKYRGKFILALEILTVIGTSAWALPAQPDGPPTGLTLAQAVDAAQRIYPATRVSQEEMNSAAAGIQLARTAYLPRIDVLAQANRATRNNVFGLLLPQSVIPSMSGPVLGTNNFGTAWGSAIGTLVTWEPFDFGFRRAGVASATAEKVRAEAALERTQYDSAVAAADSYLTLVAAQEMVAAAKAGVERAQIILKTINALVDAQLRPGADGSRAEAELAAVRTQMAQAQQAVEVARANLSRFVGIDPAQISISASRLLRMPAGTEPAWPLDLSVNPIAREQNSVVEQSRAQLRVLDKSYSPRFFLQGSLYARGTGAELNGDIQGGLNGLAPTTQNYALGFSMTFPVMDFVSIRARKASQSARIRAEAARYERMTTDLKAQWHAAIAMLHGAKAVAANTPAQVKAARAALDQATARYQSGLGNIDAVAEAHRLLTQAEIDDALARLSIWRAMLGVAQSTGDLRPFLIEAGN
jgi:outer membrane protein